MALTTGVRQANTARTRPSSENGSRSSSDPPPRATMITSTSGSRSSAASGQHHLLGGLPTLGQRVPGHDLHGRPAATGVLHHVALGRAAVAGDQPDRAGQERQSLLVVPLEQALGLQQPLGLLEASQELTLADRGDGVAVEGEATVLLVVGRLQPGHHGRALGQRCGGGFQRGRGERDRRRHVRQLVPHGDEDRTAAGATVDLDHLRLDPDRPEPVDPAPHRRRDHPQRLRVLRRRLHGHGRKATGRLRQRDAVAPGRSASRAADSR